MSEAKGASPVTPVDPMPVGERLGAGPRAPSRLIHVLWILPTVAFVGACGLGALDNFSRSLVEDRCDGTFPVCQTAAGCVMGPGRYLRGNFPGSRSFLVWAPEDAIITIDLFMENQQAAGVDTEILWHEPGCFDTYQYRSEGRDIFLEAGKNGILSKSQQVFLEGEHLIEVFSDAVASYAIRVQVSTAAGAGAE